jgi:hypothetical protein
MCGKRRGGAALWQSNRHADVPKLAWQNIVYVVRMESNDDARPHECMESKLSEHC